MWRLSCTLHIGMGRVGHGMMSVGRKYARACVIGYLCASVRRHNNGDDVLWSTSRTSQSRLSSVDEGEKKKKKTFFSFFFYACVYSPVDTSPPVSRAPHWCSATRYRSSIILSCQNRILIHCGGWVRAERRTDRMCVSFLCAYVYIRLYTVMSLIGDNVWCIHKSCTRVILKAA